jgi:hypothetical protein
MLSKAIFNILVMALIIQGELLFAQPRPHGYSSPDKTKLKVTSSTCDDELAKLELIYKNVIAQLEIQYPNLGMGWCGNVTGLAPKCDQVADKFQRLITPLLTQANFKCLQVVALFDSGPLPMDLCAHIYFGVKINGQVSLYLDPWRYGKDPNIYRFKCPNDIDMEIPIH